MSLHYTWLIFYDIKSYSERANYFLIRKPIINNISPIIILNIIQAPKIIKVPIPDIINNIFASFGFDIIFIEPTIPKIPKINDVNEKIKENNV